MPLAIVAWQHGGTTDSPSHHMVDHSLCHCLASRERTGLHTLAQRKHKSEIPIEIPLNLWLLHHLKVESLKWGPWEERSMLALQLAYWAKADVF